MAMKPKKVSSAAKKPVKRMRGGGMVAMKEPVAMKKGGPALKPRPADPFSGAVAGAAAGARSLKSIQSSMRSLAKELGMLGAGEEIPKAPRSNKATKARKSKAKGRGPK